MKKYRHPNCSKETTEKEQLASLNAGDGYTIFVRFGKLPKDEKSKNHLTGNKEIGVSVYEAIIRNNKISIIMPCLTYSACVSLSGCIDRQAYKIDGELVGYGSDNEPLLNNCRIIEEINIV